MRSLLIAGFSAAVPFASASYNGFDARSTAMGGSGVASAHFGVAPLLNPALLAVARKTFLHSFVRYFALLDMHATSAKYLANRLRNDHKIIVPAFATPENFQFLKMVTLCG